MEIKKISVDKLNAAKYNPRVDLQPEDEEYKRLKRSIEVFGYVEPIIWNERTGNIVGGHQRLKILISQGYKEIETSCINVSEEDEKVLNVSLNKVKGRWDIDKLSDILQEFDEVDSIGLTGFEERELESLLTNYDHIQDLMEDDFSDYNPDKEHDTFVMTFSIPERERENIENYLRNDVNGKIKLAAAVIDKVRGGNIIAD